MAKIEALVTQLEDAIVHMEERNASVSSTTVGWQIDHSLKVINIICESLLKSNPTDYKWKFNRYRFIIFLLGYIPRGKGRAPKIVQNNEDIAKEDLLLQLEEAKKNLATISQLPKNCFFYHRYFGDLNIKQTFYFLKLHTYHHIKIINDIVKK